MPSTVIYGNSDLKIREAVDKANKVIQDDSFYQLIASRDTPFEQSLPGNLLPAQIAEILKSSSINPFVREFRTTPGVVGRIVSKFPKVVWININTSGRHTVEALAAVIVHLWVYIISIHCEDYKFSHTEQPIASSTDTAPYWIQQLVRTRFCKLPEEKLSTQHLLKVDIKDRTNSLMDYRYSQRSNGL